MIKKYFAILIKSTYGQPRENGFGNILAQFRFLVLNELDYQLAQRLPGWWIRLNVLQNDIFFLENVYRLIIKN